MLGISFYLYEVGSARAPKGFPWWTAGMKIDPKKILFNKARVGHFPSFFSLFYNAKKPFLGFGTPIGKKQGDVQLGKVLLGKYLGFLTYWYRFFSSWASHPIFLYFFRKKYQPPGEESARKRPPTSQNPGEQNKRIPNSPSSHIEEARPTNPESSKLTTEKLTGRL